MKCHSFFLGKNKKNISECHLLKVLPKVLNVELALLLYIFPRQVEIFFFSSYTIFSLK